MSAPSKSSLFSTIRSVVSMAAALAAIGFSVASIKSLDWLHLHKKAADALVLSIKNAAGEPIPDAIVKFDHINSVFEADNGGTVRISKLGKAIARLKGSIYAPGYEDITLDLPVPNESRLVNEVLTLRQTAEAAPDLNDQRRLPYVEEVRSGPRPSGVGSNFSGWYELQAPPPKPGYEIDPRGIQFSLSGDRQCNSWSECQLVQASPTEVRLLFRLQGHSEWRSSQPAYSEAVLRVNYVPTRSANEERRN